MRSETDQDQEYEMSKEFLKKQDEVQVSRLKLARYWLGLVTTYYIFRCIFVIFPKFDRRTDFVQIMIVVQMIGMSIVLLCMIASFW